MIPAKMVQLMPPTVKQRLHVKTKLSENNHRFIVNQTHGAFSGEMINREDFNVFEAVPVNHTWNSALEAYANLSSFDAIPYV